MATLVLRNTKGSALTFTEFDSNFTGLNTDVETVTAAAAAAAATAQSSLIHPYYFFHGYAGGQIAGDSTFFDLVSGNHGTRGVDLSDANMFANSGYISTVAPASGVTDSCIRLPNLNFDYIAGEKLFIYWRGIAAGSGLAAESAIMGDGWGTSSTQHGVQIRTTTAGKVYIMLVGTTAGFGLGSNSVVFDGTNMHDFAFLVDGDSKQYGMWTDGAMDSQFAATYKQFSSGSLFDTKNSNTFNIGSGQAAPGATTQPQGGEATKTRCAVIIRFPASYTVPSVSAVTNAVKALRANPGKLLLASAL